MSAEPVADRLAIRELVHRYADAASRRDPGGIAATMAADGDWLADAMGHHSGRDAVAAFFTTMLADWNAFLQAVSSGVVVLDPDNADRAQGRWFVQETGQRTDGTNLSVSGVYHDEYQREAGGWRIGRRRYDPLLVRSDDAVVPLPFPAGVPELGHP